MKEGLWTAVFNARGISGAGVIYLANGQALGGDSLYYYKGSYEFDEATGRLQANLKATAFVAGAIPVFGIPASSFNLNINGVVSGDTATATGIVSEIPTVRMQINLVKRADKIGLWPRGRLEGRPAGVSDIYWCYAKRGPTVYSGKGEEYREAYRCQLCGQRLVDDPNRHDFVLHIEGPGVG